MLGACGRQPETNTADATSVPAVTVPERKALVACKLVSLDEMKALLGNAGIVATADEDGGATRCTWAPPDGGLPMAELKIERGMAEIAMTAFGMLGKMEPGINNPYDGLGDEAVASGPAVMIKTGDDLYTIMVMGGAEDSDKAIRKIYETAVSRL